MGCGKLLGAGVLCAFASVPWVRPGSSFTPLTRQVLLSVAGLFISI